MASTNFLVFDEGKQNMMSDGDYSANTQRARGVTPGIAYPNLHNKLYYQVSVMAKAIADFMVAQGANASDEDVEQLTVDISTAFTKFVDKQTKEKYLPLSGGTLTGSIDITTPKNNYWRLSDNNVKMNMGFANDSQPRFFVNNSNSGTTPFNIFNDDSVSMEYATSVKVPTPSTSDNSTKVATTAFVNNYAPSKTGSGANGTWGINISGNANTSTKATQDSIGQQINTTYIKGVTSNNDTLTLTKGNGTTTTTTINNVANATKALQDGNGNTITSTYLKLSGGTLTGSIDITTPKNNYWRLSDNNVKMNMGFANDSQPRFFVNNSNSGTTPFNIFNDDSVSMEYATSVKVPTPSTSDNSTKVATTAFVKSLFTTSRQQNGWWKDSNTGIIWQWGSYHVTGTKQYFTFPITFPHNLFVITEAHIVVVDTDFKTGSILNPDKNGFTFITSETGYIANIIAIGY